MPQQDNATDEIKARMNIVDVIGRVVTLKKAGSNYKGLCPFHQEKTPSFTVSESKQMYYCFGCHAGGDIFQFTQQYYALGFREALEKLADECGVTLQQSYQGTEDREALYEINRQAARYFYKNMRAGQNPAWDYMMGRGITEDTLREFGIGYADDRPDGLYRHLKDGGCDEGRMEKLGLVVRKQGAYRDKFRNRVIFPIQNAMGKVIGFGGRTLEADGIPKYLNSPETPIFYKKNNLYGLNLTRQEISREDQAILVEGYMDVISLYQNGVRNVSASLGTALTEGQAGILKRYTKNIVLSYDADQAGRAAALRGSEILHETGLKVKVLHVSDGKDPDEYIKAHGKQGFLDLVEGALPFADYLLDDIRRQQDMETMEGRAEFLEQAAGVLARLEPVEADLYINRISREFDISPDALRAQMGRSRDQARAPRRMPENGRQESLTSAQRTMIKLFLTDSGYLEKSSQVSQVMSGMMGSVLLQELKSVYKPGEPLDISQLSEETQTLVAQIDAQTTLTGERDAIYQGLIEKANIQAWKEQEQTLIARLSMADEETNKEDVARLTEELIEIQRKIKLGGK